MTLVIWVDTDNALHQREFQTEEAARVFLECQRNVEGYIVQGLCAGQIVEGQSFYVEPYHS